jgi:pimeloyl-ACP methyl ester carboxylesterase
MGATLSARAALPFDRGRSRSEEVAMAVHEATGGAGSLEVVSTDGTSIAVWIRGQGPPIVLVHGSLRDHRVFEPLVAALEPAMTTCAVDRRGFGASGDRDGYTIEQEFRDVAAVVDAIAGRAGPVVVWGHSYGAGCAMGAAALTGNVSHLVLYEPGLGIAYPEAWLAANEQALRAGDRDTVIQAVLADILEMPADEIDARRAGPDWADYLRAASTVLREARVEQGWVYRPGAFDGIRAPTLMLVGTETAPALMRSALLAVAAMPAARVQVLAGHGHLACLTDPDLVASIVTRFAGA